MDEDQVGLMVFFGFLIVIILLVLSLPVEGNILGYSVKLPIIGWIALAAFAVIALYLYFKHRA